MPWTVEIRRGARKGIEKLPDRVKRLLRLLMVEMESAGPVRGNWSNYSKLGPGQHHCHLKKGQPAYVVV